MSIGASMAAGLIIANNLSQFRSLVNLFVTLSPPLAESVVVSCECGKVLN